VSLFSENIIEDPWINMAYAFWNCTNPNFQSDTWNDAFKFNWSKTKMKQKVSEINKDSIRFTEDHWNEVQEVLMNHGINFFPKEYHYLILIVLLASGLDANILTNTLKECLSERAIRAGGDIEVKIKFPEKIFVFIVILVKTTTPQRIEITLKRRS
jgi:hypothetical protein